MSKGSIFTLEPKAADKNLVKAINNNLASNDLTSALSALGEAPKRILDYPLSVETLSALAEQLVKSQLAEPGPHAEGLAAILGKDDNLSSRLQAEIKQRLLRRLSRWQTGPSAARQLARDLHEGALADMVASEISANPDQLEALLGKKPYRDLTKELRDRAIIAKGELPADGLRRYDWIAVVDDINDASDKKKLAKGLLFGLRRYYELNSRETIIVDVDLAETDPDWEAK